MVSDEKRYEFVTQQLRYHNEKIIQAFTLFVKLVTAIVAGVAWVLTRQLPDDTLARVAGIAPWLLTLVALTAIVLIAANTMAWCGYRKAEVELAGTDKVSGPKFPRSFVSEIVMIAVIALTAFAFWIVDPL